MMFDSSGRMWSCAVWKSFNQLSSWWLLCKRYAYTLIRVSRHYYVIGMFLLCLCIFVSNKAFLKFEVLKFEVQSVRPSVCLSVTPFWLCSHHRIIMKFIGVITNDKSDVHAKGEGQRSKVKVTEVNTQLSRFRTVIPVSIHIPASIATLAQRWPNVNPYVGPTSVHQRWANVDLSIGPTVARQRWPNVVPTSAQRWHTNVGPTLAQRYANGCMPTLYQHWPNGGCVTGFLWGEPIGHRSVTGWTNSRVE